MVEVKMRHAPRRQMAELAELPNIGKVIAHYLRKIGIQTPDQLKGRDPYQMFERLAQVSGRPYDPCLLDEEAICDLRKPLWQCDPRWTITRLAENETNCTYVVIRALKAGGASFDGLTAARYLTPIGCWLPNDLSSYLYNEKDFNVLRERNSLSEQWFVHDGTQLMRALPWGEGAFTA